MNTKMKLMLLAVAMAVVAGSTSAALLVYEPFDYADGWLTGQGGALGTTGTWTAADSNSSAESWRVHPEGELSGVFVSETAPNVFDGTVDNLPTLGAFVGMAGPEDRGLAAGTDSGTGNLDASIALDPSVTATFTSGTTTWFSYVGAHAWDRNQGSPTFMICTDPTTNGSRGLTMQNSGNGIGGVGGPPRSNLQDVYPHYFSGGVHHQTPGGYLGGVFGAHDGIVTGFCSTGTCDGVLDESGQPRTQTMAWQVSDDNGFGAANIIVGKIEWDADTGGEDIISVVRFLETDELSEAAFDALVAGRPALSSANWASNKPDLDQSQFDTLNISCLKFFVDEIRIGTSFIDVVSGIGAKDPFPEDGDTVLTGDVELSWTNVDPNSPAEPMYVDVWFGTEPNELHPDYDMTLIVDATTPEGVNANSVTVGPLDAGIYYWQVDSYIYGADNINDANMIKGTLWLFYTVSDVAPTVEIVTPDQMTWLGEGVPLDTTVTDDGVSPLTYLWTADPAPGVAFDSDSIANPIVMITGRNLVREIQVGGDDTEEHLNTQAISGDDAQGTIDLTSSDLEVGSEGDGGLDWQVIAVQYNQLGIPQRAIITSAKITFEIQNSGEPGTSNDFTIYAEAADDASVFSTVPFDVTDRTLSTAWVPWAPAASPAVGTKIDTPDITALIQEVVNRSGWSDNNRLTLMIYPDVYLALGDPATGGTTTVQEIEFEAGPGSDSATLTVTYDPPAGSTPLSVPSTYTITVAVSDEANPTPDTASIEIDVYDDACQMAKFGEGKSPVTDFNANCISNLEDFAVMAAAWLDDYASTGPLDRP